MQQTWFVELHSKENCKTVGTDIVDIIGYLKVTIICRYIFLRIWLEWQFASTKFCNLYVEMVNGQYSPICYTTAMHVGLR